MQAKWAVLGLLVVLLGGALWSSLWTVSQNELGVVLRFGRVARVVPSGIGLTLPWPLETMRVVNTTEVRIMPIGFRLTAKTRGLRPTDEEVQWLTGDTNIVDLQATIQYIIADAAQYLYGMSDPLSGEAKEFAIRKAGESALTSLVAKRPIDDVLSTGKTVLQLEAIGEAQALLDSLHLGVRLTSLNITDVSPPPAVIGTFNDVASAKADRERMVTEARGEASRTLPAARADALRLVRDAEIFRSDLLGRTRGAAHSFSQLAEEAAKSPELTKRRLWLEGVERLLPRVRTKVVQPPTGGERRRVFIDG